MTKPRIGIALCGSYCTYDKLFSQLVLLSDKYELVPIMSETAAATDTRFGKAADFLSRLESLCGTKPVCSIAARPCKADGGAHHCPLHRKHHGKAQPRHNRHRRHHGRESAS